MSLRSVKAKEADLDTLLEIQKESPIEDTLRRKDLEEVMKHGYIAMLKANDEVIGFASIAESEVNAWVMQVCLKKAWREMGMFNKLLRSIVKTEQRKGIDVIYGLANEKDKRRKTVYSENGFVILNKKKNSKRDEVTEVYVKTLLPTCISML